MSKTQSKSAAKNLLAGGTAGAIEACIMYPTEYIKVQLQLAEKAATKAPFTNPINCFTWTVQNKGFSALYSGLSTVVAGSIPKAAVRFWAFSQLKNVLADESGKLSSAGTLAAGLGAGVTEAIVAVTVMETVKTKLIHDSNSPNPRFKGALHGIATIVREEGIGGLYQGLLPTMMKQGTNQMVRFSVYGRIKSLIVGESSGGDIALWQSLMAGAIAGAISVYATMPFDTVKTKMQGLEAKKYKSSLDCLLTTVRNEGVLSLWKGTTPRLTRVCFSGGIIFASYEQVMRGLNSVWPEPDW